MLESNQSFNGIWGKLEGHLARLYNIDERIEDWLTAELYMSLYTLVYEYCVSMERSSEQIATIQGKEIYEALLVFYDRLLSQLSTQQEMEDPSGYLLHWKRYEEAAPRIEAIFQYLDRFWVERERQEGRSILHIYPMLWRKWDELVLERVERRLLSYSEGCLVAERGAATGNGMFLEANSTCVKIFASYRMVSP